MKFIQLAYNGLNEWWTYLVTIFLLLFGWQFIGALPLLLVAWNKAESEHEFMVAAENNFMSLGINTNFYLILMITTFVGGLIALFIGIKYIHKRNIITVITTRSKIDWNRVIYAFSVWALFGLVVIAISYFLSPENYIWNFKPIPFLVLVLISFLLLPLQTSMEELLFRGYLMQGFGTWFKRGFVALLLTSIIFGLLHGLNPEVEKLGWISMVYYIGTGLLLGIFTIMDEGTELALGFHAANNIIAAVLVTANWTVFQTDALLVDVSEPSVGWEMIFPVFVLFPIIIYLFAIKYKWTNWNEKMFSKIHKPIVYNEDEFIA